VILRSGKADPDTRKIAEAAAVAQNWADRGDLVMSYIGAERYHYYVQNAAPYSIFPFSPLQRVKLMTNALMTKATLNVSAITRYIASRGWTIVHSPEFYVDEARKVFNAPSGEAEAAFDKMPVTPLATFKKGALTLDLSSAWAMRMAQDYVTLRTVLDIFEAMFRVGPTSETGTLVNLDGEGRSVGLTAVRRLQAQKRLSRLPERVDGQP
jgi:hypothetical protein